MAAETMSPREQYEQAKRDFNNMRDDGTIPSRDISPREKVARIVACRTYTSGDKTLPDVVWPKLSKDTQARCFEIVDEAFAVLASSGEHAESARSINAPVKGGTGSDVSLVDHAELVEDLRRVKYVREAFDEPYGTYSQPCDPDDMGAEAVDVNPDGTEAADALESLIAENAALRASASVIEPELGDLEATNADLSTRLTEAERKLAEAVEVIERLGSSEAFDMPRAIDGPLAAEMRARMDYARTFLSSKEAERG